MEGLLAGRWQCMRMPAQLVAPHVQQACIPEPLTEPLAHGARLMHAMPWNRAARCFTMLRFTACEQLSGLWLCALKPRAGTQLVALPPAKVDLSGKLMQTKTCLQAAPPCCIEKSTAALRITSVTRPTPSTTPSTSVADMHLAHGHGAVPAVGP